MSRADVARSATAQAASGSSPYRGERRFMDCLCPSPPLSSPLRLAHVRALLLAHRCRSNFLLSDLLSLCRDAGDGRRVSRQEARELACIRAGAQRRCVRPADCCCLRLCARAGQTAAGQGSLQQRTASPRSMLSWSQLHLAGREAVGLALSEALQLYPAHASTERIAPCHFALQT